jgi:serine/threonine protein kinase
MYQHFTIKALKANSYFLWFALIQIDDIVGIEQRVLNVIQEHLFLAHAIDQFGRVALDMATPANRDVINSVFLWFGRYRVTELRPEHQSATCFVFKASDDYDRDEAGVPRQVALKLMRKKVHFMREINARNADFSKEFVIHILERYPTDEEVQHWPDEVDVDPNKLTTVTKSDAEKFFCIVMPLANRNMFVSLKQERFAGRNIGEIRHIFLQLVQCVSHMHSKGILHADLKTLNIVRVDASWKLIDMDATCLIGNDFVGFKSSTAYVPPETIFLDPETDQAIVRSSAIDNPPYELVLAHPSFDVWSLGCILYQLCHSEVRPLFQGGQDDNLSDEVNDDDNLHRLAEWKIEVKTRKLTKIIDPLAKNLLSQMLSKDPSHRPTLERVISHPFLSSKQVARLIGEKAAFDVFLSYRVASDAKNVERLYNLLTARGLKVWWDKVCLEPGVEWKEGFCAGLVNSGAFVCLLSKNAINHDTITWQNFSHLKEDSRCDNVFLEHRLALELRSLRLITKIYPVMIGQELSPDVFGNFFAGGVPAAPNVAVHSVEEDLRFHLESQALGTPLEDSRTVKSVLDALLACQGGIIQGDGEEAFNRVADIIYKMITTEEVVEDKSSKPLPAVEDVSGGISSEATADDESSRSGFATPNDVRLYIESKTRSERVQLLETLQCQRDVLSRQIELLETSLNNSDEK